MTWEQPRKVAEWWWMDLNIWGAPGVLRRAGRISWKQDGSGVYSIAITLEEHSGLGLYCWPKYRALSDAQDAVEALIQLPAKELVARHGQQWPNVVL